MRHKLNELLLGVTKDTIIVTALVKDGRLNAFAYNLGYFCIAAYSWAYSSHDLCNKVTIGFAECPGSIGYLIAKTLVSPNLSKFSNI
jgi:hypothetical protein